MTCEERKDSLLLYAADLLEPAEREALRAHLATGCPACAGALAEARATLELMASTVAPIAPPAGAIDQLLARITQSSPTRLRIRPHLRTPILPALFAAAAAVLFTSGLLLYLTRDARSFWQSKNLVTVALKSPTQPNAHGQVWWDRDQQQWRVIVDDLTPAPAGREYELWFIPKGAAPMRSQTFRVDAKGERTLLVKVPSSVGTLATAAITDEPIGGSDAPTGQIHLAGEFQ